MGRPGTRDLGVDRMRCTSEGCAFHPMLFLQGVCLHLTLLVSGLPLLALHCGAISDHAVYDLPRRPPTKKTGLGRESCPWPDGAYTKLAYLWFSQHSSRGVSGHHKGRRPCVWSPVSGLSWCCRSETPDTRSSRGQNCGSA